MQKGWFGQNNLIMTQSNLIGAHCRNGLFVSVHLIGGKLDDLMIKVTVSPNYILLKFYITTVM